MIQSDADRRADAGGDPPTGSSPPAEPVPGSALHGFRDLDIFTASLTCDQWAKVHEGNFQVGDLVVEAKHAYPFEPLKLTVEGDYAKAQDSAVVARIRGVLKGLEGFTLVNDRSHADWIAYVLRPQRRDGDFGRDAKKPMPMTLPSSLPEQTPEVAVKITMVKSRPE